MKIVLNESPLEHFLKRSGNYDSSSNWVNDPNLIQKIYNFANPTSDMKILDIATGTGKAGGIFHKKVKYVVGIDICREMVKKTKSCIDAVVLAQAEKLAFRNESFDICICRQGFQFMDLDYVLKEAYRVLKKGGIFISCHLTAYNEKDKGLTFLIQRLRNPARKNFFQPKDLIQAFKKNHFLLLKCSDYITRESINKWVNNKAINKLQQKKIKSIYKNAPGEFKKIHSIEFIDHDIFDYMKMFLIKGKKE